MSIDTALRILRDLSTRGNTVAATYLHLILNQEPDAQARTLQQIETFVTSWRYEANRIYPSEFKSETVTPILKWD